MWRTIQLAAALVLVVACSSMQNDGAPATLHIVAFSMPPSVKLIPEAQMSIAEAVASAKSGARVTVMIISWGEAGIPFDWEVRAAHRRIEVVKRELIASGIPAAAISIGTVMTERDEPPPPEPGHILIFVPKVP